MKRCRSSGPIIIEVVALGLKKLLENDSFCSFSQ
jgi:hypothetical protein